MKFKLTNSYKGLSKKFYEDGVAAAYPNAKLLVLNERLADELGFPFRDFSDEELSRFLSGQTLLPNSEPIALAYAGFQFGHPVESLGDGRALLLGELNGFELQLKGSGTTAFSRRGDGRSALGPVIREYIISEAMHVHKIPTTRSLSIVETGESVYRQFGDEPGGVFTRVSPSHIRVGTFQYFFFRNDVEAIKELLDYTIARHYPEIQETNYPEKAIRLLKEFSKRQGELIAKWSALGFIHGVMNTDNCALGGFTIDYGPCAFMEDFNFHKVFSSIDQRGRYSFFNQVPIIQWNILRLADTLLPLISMNQEEAITRVEKEIIPILQTFNSLRMKEFGKKLGINDFKDEDESLILDFLNYMEKENLDFTLSFRFLPMLFGGEGAFYPKTPDLESFVEQWKNRVSDVSHLNRINPIYIPRNHLVQKAIDEAYAGRIEFTKELIKVLENPFDEREGQELFSTTPHQHEKVERTFCGT